MNMNYCEEHRFGQGQRIQMPLCDRVLSTEASSDYTLPDYQPEIRRILHVSSTVAAPVKYVSSASAEFNGIIEHLVLYVGADGNLYTVPLVSEYSFNLPVDTDGFDLNEGITSCTDCITESVTTRLTGPRKLNIKSRIRAHARLYGMMQFDERIQGDAPPESIEMLCQTVNACTFIKTNGEALKLSEEIIPECANVRVISAQGKVFITDTSSAENEVTARGEVYIRLLCSNEDAQGELITLTRRIPFSHTEELELAENTCICRAYGYINDMSVTVEEGRIICDLGINIDVEGQKETLVTYTRDIYSTERECETFYRDYTVPTRGFCVNGNFSMNERLSKENLGYPENAAIIDVYASANADGIETENAKTSITCSVKYTLIIDNDGEYSSIDVVLPAKYEFESTDTQINTSEVLLNVITAKARQDTDIINLDAEIQVSAIGAGACKIIALNEVKFTDPIKKNKAEITVCYPSSEDTHWSIAKKYHVHRKKIDVNNSISGDISGKNYLII